MVGTHPMDFFSFDRPIGFGAKAYIIIWSWLPELCDFLSSFTLYLWFQPCLCTASSSCGRAHGSSGDGTEEDWKDCGFLGPAQWARVKQAFEVDFADCDTVLFGAPTPLVFISQA